MFKILLKSVIITIMITGLVSCSSENSTPVNTTNAVQTKTIKNDQSKIVENPKGASIEVTAYDVEFYGKGGSLIFPDGSILVCPENSESKCATVKPNPSGPSSPFPGVMIRYTETEEPIDTNNVRLAGIGTNGEMYWWFELEP